MLNKIRVLIVEDSELQRNRLSHLLSLHPDVEIAGTFKDTASAWSLIETDTIDGAFLDIHIQSESERAGLDLAIRIDRMPSPKPWIVFTTDFREHSFDAHEVRPFGFIDKPLTDIKVAHVLDKIRKERQNVGLNQPLGRIEIKHKTIDRDETLWCTKYITEDDIKFIQSSNNGNTTVVKLVNGEVLDGINKPLRNWLDEQVLPNFQPINRSCLVNLNHVDGIRPDPFREDNCYVVTFRCCDLKKPISRNYLDALRNALRQKKPFN